MIYKIYVKMPVNQQNRRKENRKENPDEVKENPGKEHQKN